MKKMSILIACLILCLTMAACTQTENPADPNIGDSQIVDPIPPTAQPTPEPEPPEQTLTVTIQRNSAQADLAGDEAKATADLFNMDTASREDYTGTPEDAVKVTIGDGGKTTYLYVWTSENNTIFSHFANEEEAMGYKGDEGEKAPMYSIAGTDVYDTLLDTLSATTV